MLALAYDAARSCARCVPRTSIRRIACCESGLRRPRPAGSGWCPYSAYHRGAAVGVPAASGGDQSGAGSVVPAEVAAQPHRATDAVDLVEGGTPGCSGRGPGRSRCLGGAAGRIARRRSCRWRLAGLGSRRARGCRRRRARGRITVALGSRQHPHEHDHHDAKRRRDLIMRLRKRDRSPTMRDVR